MRFELNIIASLPRLVTLVACHAPMFRVDPEPRVRLEADDGPEEVDDVDDDVVDADAEHHVAKEVKGHPEEVGIEEYLLLLRNSDQHDNAKKE